MTFQKTPFLYCWTGTTFTWKLFLPQWSVLGTALQNFCHARQLSGRSRWPPTPISPSGAQSGWMDEGQQVQWSLSQRGTLFLFKPERKCSSPITRPLFSEELLDIYCLYMWKQDYSKWPGRSLRAVKDWNFFARARRLSKLSWDYSQLQVIIHSCGYDYDSHE